MDEVGTFQTEAAQPAHPQPTYSPQPRRKRRFFPLIALIVVIALLGIGISRFIGSKKTEQKLEPTPIPAPTEVLFPTDIPPPAGGPTEASSPTPAPTKTPTPKPTVNPIDKATGLDRSELAIEVQNGSGTAGVAGKAADLLRNLGYRIAATGNAPNFDYANIVIDVKPGKSSFLTLLKNDLLANYTIGTTSATLSASASADAVVIVGKQ